MRQVLCLVLLVALGHAAVLPGRKTRQAEFYGNGGSGGLGGYGNPMIGNFGGLRPGQSVVYQGYGNNFGIPGLKAGDEVVYEGVVGNGFQGYPGYGNDYQSFDGGYQGLQGYGGNQLQGFGGNQLQGFGGNQFQGGYY